MHVELVRINDRELIPEIYACLTGPTRGELFRIKGDEIRFYGTFCTYVLSCCVSLSCTLLTSLRPKYHCSDFDKINCKSTGPEYYSAFIPQWPHHGTQRFFSSRLCCPQCFFTHRAINYGHLRPAPPKCTRLGWDPAATYQICLEIRNKWVWTRDPNVLKE